MTNVNESVVYISVASDSSSVGWGDNWLYPSNSYPAYNYWTFWTYNTYPATVYMYQIRCPACKKMNWAKLEDTITCKTGKCGAKLRAVSSKPDHIIEIEE